MKLQLLFKYQCNPTGYEHILKHSANLLEFETLNRTSTLASGSILSSPNGVNNRQENGHPDLFESKLKIIQF